MNDFEFKSIISSDLISEIFLLGSSVNSIPNISPEANHFFQTIGIPQYSQSEIKQIQNKYISIQLDGGDVSDLLIEYSFNFPYDPNLLDEVRAVDPTTKNPNPNSISDYSFATIISLYSFLAWVMTIQLKKAIPPSKSLIKNLLFARKSNYKKLVDRTFLATMTIFLRFSNEEDMYIVADDFLTYARHIECPDLIIQYLRRFWKFPTFITNSNFFDFIKKLAITIETIMTNEKSKLKRQHNYFNENHINSIVKIMNTFITKLDNSTLELLAAIGHPLPSESAKLIIPTFGKSLEPLIMVHKPINISFESNSGKIEPLPKMETTDLKLDFPLLVSFPEGFTLSNRFAFPDPLTITEIFNSTIFEPITKIAELMANNPQYISLYVNSFNDSLRMHSDTEYFASLFAVLICSCSMIKTIYLNKNNSSTITKDNLVFHDDLFHVHFLFPTEICFKFFSQRVFNPSITIYNNANNESFSIINTLRHLSLELILSDDGSAFEQILPNSILPYALLFAEVTERLNFNISLLYTKIFSNNKLIDLFIRFAVNYQRYEMTCPKYLIYEVRKARITLFSLFNDLLMIPQGLILFFIRPTFSMNFLAFAFEDKLTKFVFEFYKNFLIAATPEEVESTTSTIFTIFTVIISKFNSDHSKETLLIILESINDAMTNHPQINFLFADDCNIIFLALPLITQSNLRKNTINGYDGITQATKPAIEVKTPIRKRKTLTVIKPTFNPVSDVKELNRKLLKEMVQFFAQTASFYTISQDQVDLLITALQSFKDPEFVSNSYNRFIQLLAGECLPSLKPFFTIRQPQILKLFIRVLIDSPKLPEILEFINELCNFSVQNIKTCQASELDLFLADLLKRDKVEEKLSEKTVKLILNLFTLLSVRHSSIYAVYKYIELLSPVSSNIIYRHEQLLLENLDSIVNKSILEPASSFPLADDNVISVPLQDLTPNDLLQKGFTTTFWLNIEETHIGYEPTIFKLEINNEIVFCLSIQHTSLTATIVDAKLISTENIFTFSDTNIWHFVSVSFEFEETRIAVKVTIDIQGGNQTFYFPELTLPHESNNKSLILLSLGGYNNLNNEPNSNIDFDNVQFPSRIANFGLFPLLDSDQRINIFELGKRIIDLDDFNSSDSVHPFKFFYKFKKHNSTPIGFLNIFTQQCGLLSLMPIFTLRSLHFKDGTPFNIDFKFALQILRNILCSSVKCQKKFYNESGLTILRTLIINNWMDEYSLNIHKYIFSLLQSLKYEELQLQLFVDIVANFGLLMKIESKQIQYKILKNWKQSVFDSYHGLVEKADIIHQILPAVIKLFEGDEYKMHRKCLYLCLQNYAEWGEFNMSFIEHLMSHSLYAKNLDIVYEINELINNLITELPRELFTFKMETNSFLFFINFYLNHSTDLIQEQVLTIYINAYQRKLISQIYAFQSSYLFIEKYTSTGESSTHLFQFISNHLLEGPFLLPFFFFLAIKLNISDNISSYLNEKQSSDYMFGYHWAIWPLLYCFKYQSQQEIVLTFLVNCCNGNYCQLFAQIQFVFFNNQAMLDKIMEKFISILQVHSIRNNSVSSDFYEISEFIIFFKLPGATVVKSLSKNDIISHQHALLNSQALLVQKVPLPNMTPNRLQIEQIIQFPTSLAIIEFGVKYLVETSEWRHKTLAIQTIQLFRKQLSNDLTNDLEKIKEKYLFFILTLCGFLETTPYDSIRDFLNWLDLKESEINENKIAVQFINYRKVRSGKEPIEEFGKVTSPLVYESNYCIFVEKNKPLKLESSLRDTFKNTEMFIKILKDKCIETTYESELMYSIEAKKLTKLFMKQLAKSDKQGKMIWKRLWKILTFDNSPWNNTSMNSISFSDKPIDENFDFSPILYPFVPLKLLPIKPFLKFERFEGKILFKAKNCLLVTIKKKIPIKLIVHADGFMIKTNNKLFSIQNSWIDEIIIKNRNDFCGLEIYTVFGITYCIETKSMEITLNFIESLEFLNKNSNVQLANYTNKWVENQISNFEYICILNKYAGRSFNEIDFYPIAPWLTFTSRFVESSQIGQLERDLKKPVNKFLKNAQSQDVNQNDVCMYLSLVKPFNSINQRQSNLENSVENQIETKSSETQVSDNQANRNESNEMNSNSNQIQTNLTESKSNEASTTPSEIQTNSDNSNEYKTNETPIKSISNESKPNETSTTPIELKSNSNESNQDNSIEIKSNANSNEDNEVIKVVNIMGDISVDSLFDQTNNFEKELITVTQDELQQFSNRSTSELIPEFFSFDRISELGIDFTYKHRQILEDPNVSASIHHWFSLTFSSLFNPNTTHHSNVSFPHRKFIISPNSFQNTITVETRTPNIASACFVDSLHVEFFTLFMNPNQIKSSHIAPNNTSQVNQSKSKSKFSKLKTNTNEEILQTARLYGLSFILKNEINSTETMNTGLMKEAKSDNSLLQHLNQLELKQKTRNRSKHKLKDKFLRKRKTSNEEMITTNNVTFNRIQKDIESPIFNNVTSVYNSSICSFIDSESLPFISYAPLINAGKSSQYDYNRNLAKNRRNGMKQNHNNTRTKRTETIALVSASASEEYWAVLLGGFVYIVEFTKQQKGETTSSQQSSIISINSSDTLNSSSMNNITSSLSLNEMSSSSSNESLVSSGSALVYDPSTPSTTSNLPLSNTSLFVNILPTKNVYFVACDGKWIVTASDSSMINVFYNKQLFTTIETFEDKIECIAINEKKKACAAIAHNTVLICDLLCGCVNAVIHALKNAKQIVISDEWGFVVVYLESKRKRRFFVFTINGDFMHETQIAEKVSLMKSITTLKGVDYLFYTLESGPLYVMNLFDQTIKGPLLNTGIDRITDVYYDQRNGFISMVTIGGNVSFTPLELS